MFDFNECVCDLNRYGNWWSISVGCLIYLCFSSYIYIFFSWISHPSLLKCSFLTIRKELLLISSNNKIIEICTVNVRVMSIYTNNGPHLSSRIEIDLWVIHLGEQIKVKKTCALPVFQMVYYHHLQMISIF